MKELRTTSVIIVERIFQKAKISKNISKQYMKELKTTSVVIVKRVFLEVTISENISKQYII